MFFELQKAGMKVVDGQQVMLDAREIKNVDEIMLLNQAAAMVDSVYHLDLRCAEARCARERHRRARQQDPYEMGLDDVEAINAISGGGGNSHLQ